MSSPHGFDAPDARRELNRLVWAIREAGNFTKEASLFLSLNRTIPSIHSDYHLRSICHYAAKLQWSITELITLLNEQQFDTQPAIEQSWFSSEPGRHASQTHIKKTLPQTSVPNCNPNTGDGATVPESKSGDSCGWQLTNSLPPISYIFGPDGTSAGSTSPYLRSFTTSVSEGSATSRGQSEENPSHSQPLLTRKPQPSSSLPSLTRKTVHVPVLENEYLDRSTFTATKGLSNISLPFVPTLPAEVMSSASLTHAPSSVHQGRTYIPSDSQTFHDNNRKRKPEEPKETFVPVCSSQHSYEGQTNQAVQGLEIDMSRKRVFRKINSSANAQKPNPETLICVACGCTDTPQWRRGQNGTQSLCNACGLHYSTQKKRILKEIGSQK